MNSESLAASWEFAELRDVGVAVLDCEHKTPPDAGEGYPYIAIPNLIDGRIDLTRVRRITQTHLTEWTRRTRPEAEDIIVTRRGRVGDTAVVPDRLACAIGQNLVILRSDRVRVDQGFLRWAARGPLWRQEVDRLRNVGAVFDSLNVRDIARMRIPVPPMAEQHRIASVLRALDDKIESNSRLVGSLEDTAATVFRARFVEFIGEEEFEPTEVGRVPRGWSVARLGDVLPVVGGATPRTNDASLWDGPHCWATPKDLAGVRSSILLDTARRITDAGLGQISSRLLPPRTVLLSSRAPVGYTAISYVPLAVNQGFIAIPPGRIPNEFVLFWLREHMDEIKAHAGGTTFAEISKRQFRPLPMVLPPPPSLKEYERLARPLLDKMAALERESAALRDVRDVLAPKLVSGVIRVREPMEVVELVEPMAEVLDVL